MEIEELRIADDDTLVREVIEPLLFASLDDKTIFASFTDESRALATLWSLAIQVLRNGLVCFIEDDPAWVVRAATPAARTFGDERLVAMLAALEPALRRGKPGRLRAPAEDVMETLGAPVEAYVGDRSDVPALDRRLRPWARERLEALLPDARRAREHNERAARARADAARAAVDAKRAEWDALRASAEPWSPKARFDTGAVIAHAKLGLGRVVAARADKIDVAFEDGTTRTLVHARP